MSGAAEQLKGVISGGVGGMCLVLAGHPFDLVKTRLQTAAPGAYPGGALDVVRASLREGGARALFRGMSAPLMGVTPIFAICIWAYGVGKDVVRAATGARQDSELSLLHIGVAGALSAVPTTAVMAPGERIKVLLLVPRAPGLPPYTGPGDVVRQLVRAEGVGSLFRGSAITLLRDGVGSFAYFGAYEGIKRYTDSSSSSGGGGGGADAAAGGKAAPPSVLSVLAGGSAAGIANWLVALPFDVVKSRIQSSTAQGKGLGMLAVAKELVAAEGVAGLYRGLVPALMRAVPANAACFAGIEFSRQALDQLF